MEYSFESIYCTGKITTVDRKHLNVKCKINDEVKNNVVHFVAPSPPNYNESFSGSGLPFKDKQQAYFNTPNKGTIKTVNNEFELQILCPNSYYIDFNTIQSPELTLKYNDKTIDISLEKYIIPYRSLQYPELRKNQQQMFYNRKNKIRSQEHILLESQYPLRESANFWGTKPPM